MTTKEIKAAIKMVTHIANIVNILCDDLKLIRGPPRTGWKSNSHTYYLLKDYFPDMKIKGLNVQESKRRLVEQHIRSFGPATITDITWWSGLTKGDVRKALDDMEEKIRYMEIERLEGDFIVLNSDEKKLKNTRESKTPTINILPELDPYPMGYKERARYLDYDKFEYIFDRSGNITSTIMFDGRVVGIWDATEKKEPLVKFHLLEKIDGDSKRVIKEEAAKVGAFITEKEVKVMEVKKMVPLPERTAGGFMSPLRDSY